MPTGTGLDRQIGYAAESTYGTGVTVTRFLPLISETLGKEINPVESAAQFAGQKVTRSIQWTQGAATVGGDVQHELYTQSIGLLFRAAFGTVTTSGTAVPYTHTFSPADKTVSFTTQTGLPTTYGSVIPFTYTGCKIQSWELGITPGEIATWGMTVIAQEETRGTAIATPSYAANLTSWHAKSATFTIGTVTVPVKNFTLGAALNLSTDRRFLGSTVIAEPLQVGLEEYTGSITVEWGNPSGLGTILYDRFIQGTESALVCTLASGTLSGTITANIRYDGTTPQGPDNGIIMHEIPYKCVASGTLDSSAISVRLVNNDATA